MIGWLETLPEPPLDLYLHLQLVLLEVEEREGQDDDSTQALVNNVTTFDPDSPSAGNRSESAVTSQRKWVTLFAWIGTVYLRFAAFFWDSMYSK